MVRQLIGSVALIAGVCAIPALAQTIAGNVNVVREPVVAQKQTILANSAEDIALQEEIAKIKAYNAYVDGQVGVSGTYSAIDNRGTETSSLPAKAPVTNPYQGKKIELFAPQALTVQQATSPRITYATDNGKIRRVTPVKLIVRSNSVQTYRISQGDTLYGLAHRQCVSVADVQKINRLNGTAIKIGQKIQLPASQCGATAQASQTRQPIAQPAGEIRHDTKIVRRVLPVQAGIKVRQNNKYAVLPKDSLYSIGRRYCVSVSDLARLNAIDASKPIQPGQILRLPNNTCR